MNHVQVEDACVSCEPAPTQENRIVDNKLTTCMQGGKPAHVLDLVFLTAIAAPFRLGSGKRNSFFFAGRDCRCMTDNEPHWNSCHREEGQPEMLSQRGPMAIFCSARDTRHWWCRVTT